MPEEGINFPTYFRRYKTIFSKRCQLWSDEENITSLLQKLGPQENTKYTNFILLKKPEEISFKEMTEILSEIFGECNCLFHTQYKCFNIVKQEGEDFISYTGKVNSQCELFKIKEIVEDMFKCLIFIQGLMAAKDKEIRSWILSIMEQNTEITWQKVTEECQKLINIKCDNVSIEERNQIERIKQRVPKKKVKYYCKACSGTNHAKSICYFRNVTWYECSRKVFADVLGCCKRLLEPEDHPDKEEEWTQVLRKWRKNTPRKTR